MPIISIACGFEKLEEVQMLIRAILVVIFALAPIFYAFADVNPNEFLVVLMLLKKHKEINSVYKFSSNPSNSKSIIVKQNNQKMKSFSYAYLSPRSDSFERLMDKKDETYQKWVNWNISLYGHSNR